jgi:hypothetical protein
VSKKHRRDLIEDHREWMDHMYNPGYWINRVTAFDIGALRWARRYNKINGLLGMLIFGLGVAALVVPAVEEAQTREISFLTVMLEEMTIFLAGFCALMFTAFLYLFAQKSEPGRSRNP